jgi:hypothetical protein
MLRCGIGARVYEVEDNIGPVARCGLAWKWIGEADRWAMVLTRKTEGKGKGGERATAHRKEPGREGTYWAARGSEPKKVYYLGIIFLFSNLIQDSKLI